MEAPEKKEKKPGGRPKKEDAQKRSHPGWGFTSTEIAAIKEQFELSNEQNIGAFIYKKVTDQPLTKNEMAVFPDELRKDFRTLSNNINQIAVALHTRKHEVLAVEMSKNVELIARQFEFLVQRLKKK